MCEPLCLGVLAPACEYLRPDLPPEQTRAGRRRLRRASLRGRPTRPPRRAGRARRAPARDTPAAVRQVALLARALVNSLHPFGTELGRGGGIASQELDLRRTRSASTPRAEVPPPRSASSARDVGEDRARLVEAAEHRQRIGARCTRPGGLVPTARGSFSSSHDSTLRHGCRAVEASRPRANRQDSGTPAVRPPAARRRRPARMPPVLRPACPRMTATSPSAEYPMYRATSSRGRPRSTGSACFDEGVQLLRRALRLEDVRTTVALILPQSSPTSIAGGHGARAARDVRAPERPRRALPAQ